MRNEYSIEGTKSGCWVDPQLGVYANKREAARAARVWAKTRLEVTAYVLDQEGAVVYVAPKPKTAEKKHVR